jgi:hypothetical protein
MSAFYSISSCVLHFEKNFLVPIHNSLVPIESQLTGRIVITNKEVYKLIPNLIVKINSIVEAHEKIIYLEKAVKEVDEKEIEEKIKYFREKRKNYLTSLKDCIVNNFQ